MPYISVQRQVRIIGVLYAFSEVRFYINKPPNVLAYGGAHFIDIGRSLKNMEDSDFDEEKWLYAKTEDMPDNEFKQFCKTFKELYPKFEAKYPELKMDLNYKDRKAEGYKITAPVDWESFFP